MSEIKKDLLKVLNATIDQKIEEINQTIADARESMANDTKSSAGDKFETGREMIQIELNKNLAQLEKNLQLKKSLSKIVENKVFDSIDFGCLVFTNQGNYFLSAPMGEIKYKNESYYALSIGSPIGKAILGKRVGDEITFQNRVLKIKSIA